MNKEISRTWHFPKSPVIADMAMTPRRKWITDDTGMKRSPVVFSDPEYEPDCPERQLKLMERR
jgi:hypothetical protein